MEASLAYTARDPASKRASPSTASASSRANRPRLSTVAPLMRASSPSEDDVPQACVSKTGAQVQTLRIDAIGATDATNMCEEATVACAFTGAGLGYPGRGSVRVPPEGAHHVRRSHRLRRPG